MKPWAWALLAGVAWVGLMIAIGVVDAGVFTATLPPAQSSAVGYRYGLAAGFGAPIVGALAFLWRRSDAGRQKTGLLAVLLAMLVFAVLSARGGLIGTKEDVRSAAYLGKVAADLNKQLPKVIDEETEMTSVSGLEGVFAYNYRLVNRAATEIDLQSLTASLQPQVTKAVCTTPETRDNFLKKGIVLRYSYADKSGDPVASFDVRPADCGL